MPISNKQNLTPVLDQQKADILNGQAALSQSITDFEAAADADLATLIDNTRLQAPVMQTLNTLTAAGELIADSFTYTAGTFADVLNYNGAGEIVEIIAIGSHAVRIYADNVLVIDHAGNPGALNSNLRLVDISNPVQHLSKIGFSTNLRVQIKSLNASDQYSTKIKTVKYV